MQHRNKLKIIPYRWGRFWSVYYFSPEPDLSINGKRVKQIRHIISMFVDENKKKIAPMFFMFSEVF